MKYFKNIKKGSVTTVEFVIILIVLTLFLFLPFALYSSYQTKAIVEDIKERTLQLVSIYGEVNDTVLDTLVKEIQFYGLEPQEGKEIIVIFSNITKSPAEDYNSGMSGEKTIVTISKKSGLVNAKVFRNQMKKAYKKDKDVIFCEMQVPADNFLNSVLGLIGTEMDNSNSQYTKAKLAYKAIGYKASEFVEIA